MAAATTRAPRSRKPRLTADGRVPGMRHGNTPIYIVDDCAECGAYFWWRFSLDRRFWCAGTQLLGKAVFLDGVTDDFGDIVPTGCPL